MRECGILLPVASLPSRYGIGAFSKEAFQFIDQLKEAGQQYWQILPLGPTGYGDSPYQAFSAFAGNPYFIDLEQLTEEGILTKEECGAVDFGENERYIDYGKLYEGRFPLLRRAYERWKQMEFADARAEAVHRLAEQRLREETREYCFYMAVKNAFGGRSWSLWDEDIRLGRAEAVREYRRRLTDEIGFYEFQQMKFEEGTYVNRGQVLFVINQDQYRAKADKNGVTIQYTPFVAQINPNAGGRSAAPKITVTDLGSFIMDYRRNFDYWNLDGPAQHVNGRPNVSGSFMNSLWIAAGSGNNTGARKPMSYIDNAGNTGLALGYVDPADNAVVINPYKFTNDYGPANGIFLGTMTYVTDGNTASVAGGTESIQLFIWFDTDFK